MFKLIFFISGKFSGNFLEMFSVLFWLLFNLVSRKYFGFFIQYSISFGSLRLNLMN